MTILPPGAKDAVVQVIIDELKGALARAPDNRHARILADAIESLEAERAELERFHAKPLEACIGNGWELHAQAIDERSRRVLGAVLAAGSPAAVLLCGAPAELALEALFGMLSEARIGGYVFKGFRHETSAYEALLTRAAGEGRVVVLVDEDLAQKFNLGEARAKLNQAWEAKVPLVLIVETELERLPRELTASCLVQDLAPKLGQATKSRDRIRELCVGAVSERTLRRLSRMTGKKTLSTLEGMVAKVAQTDPSHLEALIEIAAKTEEIRLAKGRGRSEEVDWVEPGHYHVDLINADVPLDEVLAVMLAGKGKKGARLLMSGPSGAGKTEYAKWLAKELGVPLRQRRASNLLHWRFGMFEKLIHRAFLEAARENAVLLIDEVESLIMTREANRSWAAGVSLTNTFLMELDLFQGLFVACTNNQEMLDSALMRRMTLKVGFHPLRERDRVTAYERELERFGGPMGEADRRGLSSLEGLCLGDIGNIARRLDLMVGSREQGATTTADIVGLLEKEVKQRAPNSTRRIGFT
ncbi:MAG TPA: ATP-binding protein [Rectinemataceae bacterium]|nr:ATP-binding protein [Rectinemataceae bacterium]